jgi:hypothetical protein
MNVYRNLCMIDTYTCCSPAHMYIHTAKSPLMLSSKPSGCISMHLTTNNNMHTTTNNMDMTDNTMDMTVLDLLPMPVSQAQKMEESEREKEESKRGRELVQNVSEAPVREAIKEREREIERERKDAITLAKEEAMRKARQDCDRLFHSNDGILYSRAFVSASLFPMYVYSVCVFVWKRRRRWLRWTKRRRRTW